MRAIHERRRHQRFDLAGVYLPLAARRLDEDAFTLEGHAYDLSLGGVRFELDQPIEPGSSIALRIDLPGDRVGAPATRSVFVFANIVWLEDEDEPGPMRMAAVFTRFARHTDAEALARCLEGGRYRRAA